jgi:polysaccharide biosynthesis protein PslE
MAEELRLVSRHTRQHPATTRDLLAVLFRQPWLVLISFVLTFLAVVTYGLVAPTYESEMKVLLRRGRVDPVVTPIGSQAEFEREGVTEEEVNSEVELLQDDEILRTVIQNQGLISEGHSWFWSLFGDSPERQLARAVRRTQKRLTVEAVRKAALITVTYGSSDPELGRVILHGLKDAYLERHHQVHRPSGEFNFFDQQVTQSRSALESAELRLMAFSRDEGVVSASQERDMALQSLNTADADNRQTQVAIAENSERIRALQAKLTSLPERTLTQIRNSDNPQLLEKMKSRLLELELKRTELLTQYEPGYRLVQELDDEIAHTKTTIAAEEQAPLRDQASDLEPNHEWAKSELVKADVQAVALVAHSRAESSLLAHYRDAAHQLSDRATEQEFLLQELKEAEDKYLLYVNKREEARIEDALDQGGILNVTIAEQPIVPALAKISVLGFGFIGLGCAGTFSVGLAFVMDYLNPAFRTPDEVIAYLQAPVLASLPRGSRKTNPTTLPGENE